MGCTHHFLSTKKSIISELIEGWENKTKSGVLLNTTTYLKHCYRGNNFKGVLWVVFNTKVYDENGQITKDENWIACNLLEYWRKPCEGWAYKDMDESMGPFYYSCPLGYLDLAPEKNAEWREKVRKYHQDRKCPFKLRKGMYVKLKEGWKPTALQIINIRPLLSNGYGRLPRKAIEKEITREEYLVL
jgi:hypothetical protein